MNEKPRKIQLWNAYEMLWRANVFTFDEAARIYIGRMAAARQRQMKGGDRT